MPECLVTNSQYALFIQDGGYSRQEFWSDRGWRWVKHERVAAPGVWRNPEFNAPNQPVVGVSWWEAEAFCGWAGGVLPTANQSEAAARGPEGLVYPWGDEWENGICALGVIHKSRRLARRIVRLFATGAAHRAQNAAGLPGDFLNGVYFTVRPTLNETAHLPQLRSQIKYGGI